MLKQDVKMYFAINIAFYLICDQYLEWAEWSVDCETTCSYILEPRKCPLLHFSFLEGEKGKRHAVALSLKSHFKNQGTVLEFQFIG